MPQYASRYIAFPPISRASIQPPSASTIRSNPLTVNPARRSISTKMSARREGMAEALPSIAPIGTALILGPLGCCAQYQGRPHSRGDPLDYLVYGVVPQLGVGSQLQAVGQHRLEDRLHVVRKDIFPAMTGGEHPRRAHEG